MENYAERIIENARENAKDSLADADAEIEKSLQVAEERGKKKAEEQATDIQRKLQMFRTLALEELQTEILRSSVFVAKEVLKQESESNPEIVLQLAMQALKTAKDAQSVTLRVNQEDVAHLRSNKEQLLEGLERAAEIEVRADRAVAKGGLILQTESGIIDAQLETQLEEIANALGV